MPTMETVYDAETGKPMKVYAVDARELLANKSATRYPKGESAPEVAPSPTEEQEAGIRQKLGEMKVPELRGLAEQYNVTEPTKLNKAELIDALVPIEMKQQEGAAGDAD